MPSIRTPESIAKLAKVTTATAQLPASRINIGPFQYVTTSALTLNTATSGVGGFDATIQPGKLYYVYAVLSNGVPALIASLSSSAPSGYTTTTSRLIGHLYLDGSSNIDRALYLGQYDSESNPSPDNPVKNIILNGNMDFWQKGTSFTAATSYTADRFTFFKSSSASFNVTRSTDVPNINSNFSLLATVGTASTPSAGDFNTIAQRIEGSNWLSVAGKPFTLGFWVKSSITGTFAIGLQNSGSDRTCVGTYAINSANTWEYKTIFFPGSVTTGTWNYSTGIGLNVFWSLGTGSTYQTSTLLTWQSANLVAATGQTQLSSTLGATFQLSQVVLTPGWINLNGSFFSYSGLDLVGELTKVQRYVQTHNIFFGVAFNTTSINCQLELPVTMRAAPTITPVTLGSTTTAALQFIQGNNYNQTQGGPSLTTDVSSIQSVAFTCASLTSLSQGAAYQHGPNDGKAVLLDAEL